MKVTMLPWYVLKIRISILIPETNQNKIPDVLTIFSEHVQRKKQKTVKKEFQDF